MRGSSHAGCPAAVDTHCGTLCDASGKPCSGCDWEERLPYCLWISERCQTVGEGGCPCRLCEGGEKCWECDEKRCVEVW